MNSKTNLPNTNPFPGLRPFLENEEHLFFGRESQVDAMVDKLAATRFLSVVGTSGSGKSSLVNCGLEPALRGGLMASAGTSWHMAKMRPGSDPLQSLSQALAENGVLFRDYPNEVMPLQEIVDITLRISKLGLIDIVNQAKLKPGVNLLLVVDQFEELFRYKHLSHGSETSSHGSTEQATEFVNLLLEAIAQSELPIYIVLTMRSDFLGDCAQFAGLAEAINTSQYLVPRLTREQRRAAISGPVGAGGAKIDPVLLTRLVNDVGDNPDQLSILQHALNRTWSYWENVAGAKGPLSLQHYEAVGSMQSALDQHAERTYDEVKKAGLQLICKKMFKALTDKATDARGVRRPTTLGNLCALTESGEPELRKVIEIFRQPSRSFLMPPVGVELESDTVIDISHESLMRVWKRLDKWASQEALSAQMYRRLGQTAALYEQEDAGLLRDADLRVAQHWRKRSDPNQAWANRYNPAFATTMDFLRKSEKAQSRRRYLRLGTLGAAIISLAAFAGFSNYTAIKAEEAAIKAEEATTKAEEAAEEAEKAKIIADEQTKKAKLATAEATEARERLRLFTLKKSEDVTKLQLKVEEQQSVIEDWTEQQDRTQLRASVETLDTTLRDSILQQVQVIQENKQSALRSVEGMEKQNSELISDINVKKDAIGALKIKSEDEKTRTFLAQDIDLEFGKPATTTFKQERNWKELAENATLINLLNQLNESERLGIELQIDNIQGEYQYALQEIHSLAAQSSTLQGYRSELKQVIDRLSPDENAFVLQRLRDQNRVATEPASTSIASLKLDSPNNNKRKSKALTSAAKDTAKPLLKNSATEASKTVFANSSDSFVTCEHVRKLEPQNCKQNFQPGRVYVFARVVTSQSLETLTLRWTKGRQLLEDKQLTVKKNPAGYRTYSWKTFTAGNYKACLLGQKNLVVGCLEFTVGDQSSEPVANTNVNTQTATISGPVAETIAETTTQSVAESTASLQAPAVTVQTLPATESAAVPESATTSTFDTCAEVNALEPSGCSDTFAAGKVYLFARVITQLEEEPMMLSWFEGDKQLHSKEITVTRNPQGYRTFSWKSFESGTYRVCLHDLAGREINCRAFSVH